MKKTFASVAVFAALAFGSSVALASGGVVGGAIIIGGGAQVSAGTVTGKANSVSQGNAVAASQIAGSGSSYHSTTVNTGGNASIGGAVNFNESSVVTSANQYATVDSFSETNGQPAIDSDGLILNGTTGFGSSESKASGKATFNKAGIGAVVGIGGIGGFFAN